MAKRYKNPNEKQYSIGIKKQYTFSRKVYTVENEVASGPISAVLDYSKDLIVSDFIGKCEHHGRRITDRDHILAIAKHFFSIVKADEDIVIDFYNNIEVDID